MRSWNGVVQTTHALLAVATSLFAATGAAAQMHLAPGDTARAINAQASAAPRAMMLNAGDGCTPEWVPTFGGGPGLHGEVHDLVEFDDGTGPAVYAVGQFSGVNGEHTGTVAKWDGAQWHPIVDGPQGPYLRAATVFDDGTGPALYVVGTFITQLSDGTYLKNIAKWDGKTWSSPGGGIGGATSLYDVIGFDDGSSSALYVTGKFEWFMGGGAYVRGIAKWNGQQWSPLGTGFEYTGYCMAVFDDGSGPVLFVAGFIPAIGFTVYHHVVKWDGANWLDVGGGVDKPVYDMTVFDDGSGPALYVGGAFEEAGGRRAQQLARWDGSSWSEVGGGTNGELYALETFDDGAGPALYVGGLVTNVGGVIVNHIAKWDGTTGRRSTSRWTDRCARSLDTTTAAVLRCTQAANSITRTSWS